LHLITLNNTHSVGLLRTRNQPVARPLPDNTQHSHETDIRGPCGIRTNNSSKRAAADSHLRRRGQRNRSSWRLL